MTTGTVKFFDMNRGFGFIRPDDGSKDVFVHITAVNQAGLDTLSEEQKLQFTVTEQRGKAAAADLRKA